MVTRPALGILAAPTLAKVAVRLQGSIKIHILSHIFQIYYRYLDISHLQLCILLQSIIYMELMHLTLIDNDTDIHPLVLLLY